MKIYTATAITILMASAATAGPIGGSVELTYGNGQLFNEVNSQYQYFDYFETYAIKGAFGAGTEGGFGWQVDVDYQETDGFRVFPTATLVDFLSKSYGATLHGNYDLAGFKLGAFAGFGGAAARSLSQEYSVSWYGLEAAKTFGNIAVSAHIGLTNSNTTGGIYPLTDELFSGIEARYFLGDGAMITGSYSNFNTSAFGNPMTVNVLELSGTQRLGQSNFYGTLGYQNYRTEEPINPSYGTEERYFVGISMLFGGSLRDIYAGSTPMMSNELQSLSGAWTELYND